MIDIIPQKPPEIKGFKPIKALHIILYMISAEVRTFLPADCRSQFPLQLIEADLHFLVHLLLFFKLFLIALVQLNYIGSQYKYTVYDPLCPLLTTLQ